MLALEYDPELAKQAWIEKARNEEKISMVKNLLKAGTPLEYLVAATGWTKEQILSLADTKKGVGEYVGVGI